MVQFDTSGCTSPKETGLERSSREPYSSHGVAGAVGELIVPILRALRRAAIVPEHLMQRLPACR